MRVLVGVLTSFDADRARRTIRSIELQRGYTFDIDVVAFCNTLDEGYLKKLVDCVSDLDVTIVETESDGSPGGGKQSVLNWFVGRGEFDALIFIDGDDLFYPCAFSVIEDICDNTNADVIGLLSHDMLYDWECDLKRVRVDNRHWLISWFGEQLDHAFGRDYTDRFKNIGTVRTPDRLVWFTRKMFSGLFRPWFTRGIQIYEDYVASLSCLAAHLHSDINYVQVSTSNIYIHDMTKRRSVCNIFIGDGNKYTDLDDAFTKIIFPLNLVIGTNSFDSCIYYENPNEDDLQIDDRIAFIRSMI